MKTSAHRKQSSLGSPNTTFLRGEETREPRRTGENMRNATQTEHVKEQGDFCIFFISCLNRFKDTEYNCSFRDLHRELSFKRVYGDASKSYRTTQVQPNLVSYDGIETGGSFSSFRGFSVL